MLSHEYFESLLLIIAQVLLVQLQVRNSDVIIYVSLIIHPRLHTGDDRECFPMPFISILMDSNVQFVLI